MIKQKLISFKIDEDCISQLDLLCKDYGLERNEMLNLLFRTGCAISFNKKAKFAIF